MRHVKRGAPARRGTPYPSSARTDVHFASIPLRCPKSCSRMLRDTYVGDLDPHCVSSCRDFRKHACRGRVDPSSHGRVCTDLRRAYRGRRWSQAFAHFEQESVTLSSQQHYMRELLRRPTLSDRAPSARVATTSASWSGCRRSHIAQHLGCGGARLGRDA